ncbi:putative histidine kinase [Lupinus albus]|uniref:histidine kinase n=1 Tax=Lupinus albus TaxID=3870 RepID=A0A6A4P4L2_LUPAL|nr:putative histidine kinase [Lupinus albus]
MSLSRRLSSSNGKLQQSMKFFKGNEPLHRSNSDSTCRRKPLLLLIFGLVAIGSAWFLLSFNTKCLMSKENEAACGGRARILLHRYNIIKKQLHAQNTMQSWKLRLCEIKDFISLSNLVKGFWWGLIGIVMSYKLSGFCLSWRSQKHKIVKDHPVAQKKKLQHFVWGPSKSAGRWRKKFLVIFVSLGIIASIWLFWHLNMNIMQRREHLLANMCDERARMLQDQFNVSMNHVHALAILVSTFHHDKHPSAINQKIFGEYTESTAFERPLTSGVAYAMKVLHSDRMHFERQHGWTIKKMETENEALVQDCIPENLDPAPFQDEYAPVIFAQETVSHIVSIGMMSGKVCLAYLAIILT